MSKTIKDQLSEERKTLQASGDLPEWFTTQGWQMFKSKYMWKGGSYKTRIMEIAKCAAKHTNDPAKWTNSFFDLMWKGWLAPSTPVLANMGTDRGCPVSCSGNYIGDSVYSYYEGNLEAAMLSKNGFGTSSYLGDIRPRGSKISSGGEASGVVPVIKSFVNVAKDISQGSNRRGAWAGYIGIDHEDFWEIVNYINTNPDDLNIGWNVTDSFIERLENKDAEAISRFQRALKIKMVTGKGYFFFVDRANRLAPQMYKDQRFKIKASNLCCVIGDDKALTENGYISVRDLNRKWKGKRLVLHDGDKFSQSKTPMKKISSSENVFKLTLENGLTHTITRCHKVMTDCGMKRLDEISIGSPIQCYSELDGKYFSTVKSIEYAGRSPVYCLEMDNENHSWVCNGIVTSNSEISLPSTPLETFTCVLSSLNLKYYDDIKGTDAVFIATVFLDCVAQEFIEIGKNIRGLEKAVRFTERHRALGLGTLGFATYLQENMIPFESFDAHMRNLEIFKYIREEAEKASRWMAEEYGEPEVCKGYGVRNTTLISVAPNLSSSVLAGGCSQGIEPLYSNVYTQGSAAGEMQRISPTLIKVMKEKGVYDDEHIDDIVDHAGSVSHVDWLTDEEKLALRTAFEIDQNAIIRLASARQQFIDQAQSINLFFDADADERYIAEVHKAAFLDSRIKSLYYIRSKKLKNKVEEPVCIACEG